MIDISRNRISRLSVFGVVVICSLLAFGFAPSARADATYTYTGQPFTYFQGADSCTNGVGECSLSGTVTFASPLPPNHEEPLPAGCCGSLSPLSFSFTDGVHTLNSSNSAFSYFFLWTGSDGQIDGWFLGSEPITMSRNETQDLGSDGPLADLGTISDITGTVPGNWAWNENTPGTWTLTTTPEPSSLILLGMGLLGMAGAWRWKRCGRRS
jgi:hypothetical protein